MKKITLLVLVLFTSICAKAQCEAVAFNFGNNSVIPPYNVVGDVTITLNQDNTITLDLANNFMTASGPDIRAFLVNPDGLTDQELLQVPLSSLENFQFGLVGSDAINQNGAKSFTVDIPSDIDISEYTKIYFYCLEFEQFWDFGTFNAFSEVNCSILSTSQNSLGSIAFSPNPTTNVVRFLSPSTESLTVSIYDAIGKKVQEVLEVSEGANELDLSTLKSGIYYAIIENIAGQVEVRQIIKQ